MVNSFPSHSSNDGKGMCVLRTNGSRSCACKRLLAEATKVELLHSTTYRAPETDNKLWRVESKHKMNDIDEKLAYHNHKEWRARCAHDEERIFCKRITHANEKNNMRIVHMRCDNKPERTSRIELSGNLWMDAFDQCEIIDGIQPGRWDCWSIEAVLHIIEMEQNLSNIVSFSAHRCLNSAARPNEECRIVCCFPSNSANAAESTRAI